MGGSKAGLSKYIGWLQYMAGCILQGSREELNVMLFSWFWDHKHNLNQCFPSYSQTIDWDHVSSSKSCACTWHYCETLATDWPWLRNTIDRHTDETRKWMNTQTVYSLLQPKRDQWNHKPDQWENGIRIFCTPLPNLIFFNCVFL